MFAKIRDSSKVWPKCDPGLTKEHTMSNTLEISESSDLEKSCHARGKHFIVTRPQAALLVVVVLLLIFVTGILVAMFGPGSTDLKYRQPSSNIGGTEEPSGVNCKAANQSTKEQTTPATQTTTIKPPSTAADQSTTKPTTSSPTPTSYNKTGELQCGVAIVGAGTAGLLMATTLLESKNVTSVCVFEKEDRLGGRILDHVFPQAPNVSVGLGVWKFAGEHELELDLYNHLVIYINQWVAKLKRVETRGVFKDDYEILKSAAFPTLLKRYPTNNYTVREVALYVGGDDHVPGENFRYFSTAENFLSYYLSPEGAEFFEDIYGFSNDYMQKINPKSYRKYIMDKRPNTPSHDDDSRPEKGMSELIIKLNKKAQALGARIFTREAVDSIHQDGSGFVIQTNNFTVRANKTVLAVGPSAVKNMGGNVAKNITDHVIFQSIVGVPQFEGAAVYAKAWWNDTEAHQKNNSLEPLQMFISSSDCLGITMPYEGRGPNNESVLHTMSNNGACSDKWGNILKLNKSDLDREMKRALEYKFQRKDIPDPLETVYKYWDGGVWFLQRLGTDFDLTDIQQWAKRPLGKNSDVFLVGGAYNSYGGWLEAAIDSVNIALKEGWEIKLPFPGA